MSKSLGLSIPELVKPEKDHFDLRQKNVDEWLDNLPRANIGETARRVFETLVEANRFKHPHQNRMHFLEASRETVMYVTDSMKRHFVGINAPLPAKNLKIVAATREIHHAMAIGYMIATENYLGSSLFFSDNKQLATMIQRALSSLGKVLLTCYQTYTPYPANVWSEIHKLYGAAEGHKLLSLTVVDDQNLHNVKTSINAEYIRILLMALTSPYRLRHGEAGKVYSVLERWSGKSRLKSTENITRSGSLFAVNLASDEAPKNYSLFDDSCKSEFCRILNSASLTKAIRKDLKHGFKTGETTITSIEINRPDLSQDLMKRLLIAWCIIPKRSYPRNEIDERVQVTLGLTSTHQVIINGNRNTRINSGDEFENTASFETSNVSVSNLIADKQPDVWDMIYFPGDTGDLDALEEQLHKDQGSQNKQKKEQSETWLILNESASGYCIKSVNEPKGRCQVGELIGIRRQTANSTWKWGIGVIRWLRSEQANSLMIGIEMLTPDAAAIGLRAPSNAKHDYRRTLMLPELSAVNQPTTLVTTAVPYRIGHKLVINILGKEILIKLSKQVQNTGLFAQFQFEIMDDQGAVLKGEQEDENTPDFSGVWTSI